MSRECHVTLDVWRKVAKCLKQIAVSRLAMRGFGNTKVLMDSERNGRMFVCGIKPYSTPVQRYT